MPVACHTMSMASPKEVFEPSVSFSKDETEGLIEELLRDIDLDDIVCSSTALQSEGVGPCCIF